MCWNIEISAASALVGWCTCFYLWRRRRSPRDEWYARYLLTFTFTQLIDIALWLQHRSLPNGLQACAGYKEQFSAAPSDEQYQQFVISKYMIPLVVFSQHFMQLSYPSNVLSTTQRIIYQALHALPLIGMSFQFACSDLVESLFPEKHWTLRWGGHTAETWQVLIISGLVAFDFWLLIPEKSVAFVHVAVLAMVMSFLWKTEGTLALGSKWCTYCLIYSAVYIAEPLWGPKEAPKKKTKSL